ncbi:hypothetical protein T4E_3254 [Trichinella pseudospiralis]|uniref:Uncharacterized protein n=1 Tax=Trichinella pseudospiralis TaxID=6337 RepID=A0A0V0Y0D6_TRIPS|nr:hypothetical protein T4E_3254 [Trichinella pseudospiralis]
MATIEVSNGKKSGICELVVACTEKALWQICSSEDVQTKYKEKISNFTLLMFTNDMIRTWKALFCSEK